MEPDRETKCAASAWNKLQRKEGHGPASRSGRGCCGEVVGVAVAVAGDGREREVEVEGCVGGCDGDYDDGDSGFGRIWNMAAGGCSGG